MRRRVIAFRLGDKGGKLALGFGRHIGKKHRRKEGQQDQPDK
jgi:hypothetical protein